MKFLGLRTEPIGNTGNGLWLLNETRTKIHDLVLEYGLQPYEQGPSDHCPQCARVKWGARPQNAQPVLGLGKADLLEDVKVFQALVRIAAPVPSRQQVPVSAPVQKSP